MQTSACRHGWYDEFEMKTKYFLDIYFDEETRLFELENLLC